MRILILGGDGMLGHRLFQHLIPNHEVKCTLRGAPSQYLSYRIFSNENSYFNVDASDIASIDAILNEFRPEAAVNCIGIVKQRPSAKESIPSIEINALLPHKLSIMCGRIGAKLIHMSTDCVFSGRRGNYQETDFPDAEDLYGRTKLLGEVTEPNCITLRTSIIGLELSRKKSLIEWFLAQEGTIRGFRKAIYTGFTTAEMSRIIEMLLTKHPTASGLYQVSSEPINKYDLLQLFRQKLNRKIEILPDDSFHCDRSLGSERFRTSFNYTPPSWNTMLSELSSELPQNN